MVSVAVAEVTGGFAPELRVTDGAEKLHEDSLGSPEHSEGERLMVPLNPFCVVNVTTVDPADPGLVMLMLGRFAESPKLGAGVIVTLMEFADKLGA